MNIATPQLAAALAKANAIISNPAFDKVNPHFRSKYASHAAVRNAIVPAYAANGLSVIQDVQTGEGTVACFTTIIHESGEERVYGPCTMPVTKSDAQGYASAATYAKRVHLQGVANVVGDEDDDAESAVGRNSDQKPAAVTPIKGVTTTSPRGDAKKNADQKKVDLYTAELVKAATLQDDMSVRQLWDELKADHDSAIVTWDTLKKKYGSEYAFIEATLKPTASTGEGRRS